MYCRNRSPSESRRASEYPVPQCSGISDAVQRVPDFVWLWIYSGLETFQSSLDSWMPQNQSVPEFPVEDSTPMGPPCIIQPSWMTIRLKPWWRPGTPGPVAHGNPCLQVHPSAAMSCKTACSCLGLPPKLLAFTQMTKVWCSKDPPMRKATIKWVLLGFLGRFYRFNMIFCKAKMTATLRTPYCHTEEAFLYCWKSAALSMAPAVLAGANGGVEANCIRLAVILETAAAGIDPMFDPIAGQLSNRWVDPASTHRWIVVIQKSYDLQHLWDFPTFHFRSMVHQVYATQQFMTCSNCRSERMPQSIYYIYIYIWICLKMG